MLILAIETSCDDTAVAILETSRDCFFIRTSLLASQANIHARYGGVVPEVAARTHIVSILPLIKRALGKRVPDCIAVTAGPGLITSLLVGVHTARALSYIYKCPFFRINHIEGHIYASWLQEEVRGKGTGYRVQGTVKFPALALIVSGGHTELILMKDHGQYKLIGKTLDDAAGEAFDKAAKIFGLPYPGGPVIARRAPFGDKSITPLPAPLLDSDDYSFSFSGLKTAVLYRVLALKKTRQYSEQMRDNLCAAFQHSVVSVLVEKTIRAVKEYSPKSVLLGGGVAANIALRKSLTRAVYDMRPKRPELIAPPFQYCTDNAAMIAVAAFFKSKKRDFSSPFSCHVDPLWDITHG